MAHQPRKYILIPEDRYNSLLSLVDKNKKELVTATPSSCSDNIKIAEIDEKHINKESPFSKGNEKCLQDIISYFPSKMKSRARLISSYIDKDNSTITLNTNGELVINGNVLKGSSLTDLLYDACCPKRKHEPIGAADFYAGLKLNNLPVGFIRNKERHNYFLESKPKEKDFFVGKIKWKSY